VSTLFGEPRWSNAELAEVFGISPQRLGVLCKAGVLPLATDGLHEPKAVVAAYVRHLKQKKESSSQADETMTKMQLDNEMRRIKLRRIAGELVPVERLEQDWFAAARRVRDAALNLIDRLSGVFAAESSQEKIHQMFTKEMHAVLTELSIGQRGQPATEQLPLEESLATAAETESETPQDIIVWKSTGVGRSVPGENYRIMSPRVIGEDTEMSEGRGDRFSTGD
jgi:hypothetical protein